MHIRKCFVFKYQFNYLHIFSNNRNSEASAIAYSVYFHKITTVDGQVLHTIEKIIGKHTNVHGQISGKYLGVGIE